MLREGQAPPLRRIGNDGSCIKSLGRIKARFRYIKKCREVDEIDKFVEKLNRIRCFGGNDEV